MTTSLFDSPQLPEGNFSYEQRLFKQGFSAVGGSDEVGRGPLAGPVVAATVILPPQCDPGIYLDSKKISERKREILFDILRKSDAHIGIGIVSEEKIDTINILQASLLAMKLSAVDLAQQGNAPDYILVDGKFEIPHPIPQQALIKGETKSASIAAASIIAKVTRDRIMEKLDAQYPVYYFKQNKGYPTQAHRKAIAEYGPCTVHRKTFRGVKEHVK